MDQFDNFALHQQKTSNIEYSELLRQEFSILMGTPGTSLFLGAETQALADPLALQPWDR